MSFVHLHCHTHYSLLKALPQIDDLIKTVKEQGMTAIALTDNGALYGAIEFYETCKKEGVKPIIGCELYMVSDRADRSTNQQSPFHLTVLAQHYEGYKNLMRLVSRAAIEGLHEGLPRADKNLLRELCGGLIILSGCKQGEIAQLILSGNKEKAQRVAEEYRELCGAENFYLELQDHPDLDGQFVVNEGLQDIARATGIPLVVTRDVHYIKPDDAEACEITQCIGVGKTVHDHRNESLVDIDRSLSTVEQIQSRWRHLPEALENTVKIADRINIEIALNVWHFPPIEKPDDKTYDEVLREQVYEGIARLLPEVTQENRDRLEYELGIIKTKGYAPYFLAVADYILWAREKGIVTTTRGSAAGSLVSYAIGIVAVNPLFFKLPFERFLNPFRPSPPDVDGDFADDRREEVIEYVTQKYGKDRVAQIITFGTMAARASVRDSGRALGFSYGFCDRVSKLIPFGAQGTPMTIDKALVESPDLKRIYDEQPDVQRLLNIARKLEGNARHTSIHAAGVVISPEPLTEFSPVQFEVGGSHLTTQYEMHSVETAGVLKMDFLGIRNLSILGNAVTLIKQLYDVDIDLQKIPWDDKKTYDMLARGETVGVFQLSGAGMTRYLKELRPSSIFDIMAMVALFRPGPMDSIPEYIRRKHNPALVTYLDDRLKSVLDQSLGILVYQDDVLLSAIEVAGYNWEEADKFRKAMGKKIPEEMAKQKLKFFAGCLEGGMSQDKVEILWQLIEPFAAYGFNKCLTGDACIVDVETGKRHTLAELYKSRNNKKIFGVAGGRLKKIQPRWIRSNGRKNIVKIITRSGREIRCTKNHRFMGFNGWLEAQELSKGVRIAMPRTLNVEMKKRFDRSKLAVLGYLLSEGNLCHPHGIYYYSTQENEIFDFIKNVRSFENIRTTIDRAKATASVYIGKVNKKEKNGLMQWCQDIGLTGKTACEKFIPEFVFEINRDDLAVFIGKLWQGDGSVSAYDSGHVYYATSSQRLATDLQHLLLRFGIWSVVHTKKFKYRGGHKTGYTVEVSSYGNIKLFGDYFGKYLIGAKKIAIIELIKKIKKTYSTIRARGTSDTIPVGVYEVIRREMSIQNISAKKIAKKANVSWRLLHRDARRKGYLRGTIAAIGKALVSEKLIELSKSDLYWDEIKSVAPCGVEEVFDLSVPEVENFVANDFVTHNSHAASYAVVAYNTAYLKAHYSSAYMTSVMSAESDDIEKLAEVTHECERMGIKVLPPDINHSFEKFAVAKDDAGAEDIRFGLSAIKNVGAHITSVIIEERRARGAFSSLADFLQRARDKDLNKKSIESLIKCGAMDVWGDRGILLANVERMLVFAREHTSASESNQGSLLGLMGAPAATLVLQPAPPAELPDKLRWEKELIGLYISSHPCAEYAQLFAGKYTEVANIEAEPAGGSVLLVCIIGEAKKKWTKNHDAMMNAKVEDLSGSVEVMVFPKSYEKTQAVWNVGVCIGLLGRRSSEQGDNKIFVEHAEILQPETAPETKKKLLEMLEQLRNKKRFFAKRDEVVKPHIVSSEPITIIKSITIDIPSDLEAAKKEALKNLLASNRGDTRIYLSVLVGAQKRIIETDFAVAWDAAFEQRVAALIGDGRIVRL